MKKSAAPFMMRLCLFVLAVFLITLSSGHGKTFEEVTDEYNRKLSSSVERLSKQRAEIQSKQIPLARELNELRAKAKELRKEANELQSIQDSKNVALSTLEARINGRRKEYNYIVNSLLIEYISAYDAGLSIGEKSSYGESVRKLNLDLESGNHAGPDILKKNLELVLESIQRIKGLNAGKVYDGEVLDSEGISLDGKFIQLGPLLYFSSKDKRAGLVEESISLRPQLLELDGREAKEINAFAEKAAGDLPVDPSLEYAVLLEQTKDSVFEHLKKGGIWVIPILLFAAVSTLVALLKLMQIFSIREPQTHVIHELVKHLRNGEHDKAKALVESQPEPARDMLARAVKHSGEHVDLVEEVMYESMMDTQPKLERYLNVIAVTAATAPLLGLLGTVTGIIKTFKLMYVFGAGDPRPLISGISEALITTELGLVLAIPALIIHALLSRKVAGVMARLEKLAIALTNGLARKTS